uniref:Uncharacterized protein n=1 Tax=Oryza brachyantha TaxID=4533 RepID=J3LFW0_ORYBR
MEKPGLMDTASSSAFVNHAAKPSRMCWYECTSRCLPEDVMLPGRNDMCQLHSPLSSIMRAATRGFRRTKYMRSGSGSSSGSAPDDASAWPVAEARGWWWWSGLSGGDDGDRWLPTLEDWANVVRMEMIKMVAHKATSTTPTDVIATDGWITVRRTMLYISDRRKQETFALHI